MKSVDLDPLKLNIWNQFCPPRTCYNCEFSGIYKFNVQQIRRRPEIQLENEEEIRSDHLEIWETIPRFAEIPETVKCKNCREVLTVEVTCIY